MNRNVGRRVARRAVVGGAVVGGAVVGRRYYGGTYYGQQTSLLAWSMVGLWCRFVLANNARRLLRLGL